MDKSHPSGIENFFVVGLSYKNTDPAVRGLFAINPDQYSSIISAASAYSVSRFFILSTCNRTELYGFAAAPSQLIELLCAHCEGDAETFSRLAYVKNGADACAHLFHVGCGMDSQILGDYEIVAQLKNAAKISKAAGRLDAFLERLLNSVLQAAKNIRTHTQLSGGTVSVAFAAVQFVRDHCADVADKNILLIGTGKTGRSACRNLVDYLGANRITLINRSSETAEQLANELQLRTAPITRLSEEITAADVVLVATNSPVPLVLTEHLSRGGEKLVIDLSIPCNVEQSVRELPHIKLINVDELSRIKDGTLLKRKAELPKALAIVDKHNADFLEWVSLRKHAPLLKAVKHKLMELQGCDMFLSLCTKNSGEVVATPDAGHRIQQVVNGTAAKMQTEYKAGCNYIEAINEYLGVHER